MDSSYEDNEQNMTVPLISRASIPNPVKDDRKPYQKQIALYIILACTLFERFAFYTLAANLSFNMESDKAKLSNLGPTSISYIFSGMRRNTWIFAVYKPIFFLLIQASAILRPFSLLL